MNKWIIEKPSGISGNCLLGEGNTEQEAWDDAFGPNPNPKMKRGAWSKQVTEEELEELKEARASR